MQLDVHPEIKDPLLRTLADNSDYKPELALEAGEKLLAQRVERKDIKQILKDLIAICDKQWRKYLHVETPEGQKNSSSSTKMKSDSGIFSKQMISVLRSPSLALPIQSPK